MPTCPQPQVVAPADGSEAALPLTSSGKAVNSPAAGVDAKGLDINGLPTEEASKKVCNRSCCCFYAVVCPYWGTPMYSLRS